MITPWQYKKRFYRIGARLIKDSLISYVVCCLLLCMGLPRSGIMAQTVINGKDTSTINTKVALTPDSLIHNLSTVTITAFQGKGDGTDIAASVFPINQAALQFFDKSSFISTFNTAPGVRLEQRSPGSLRLSIRGSLLRSPYGVRSIKFYMDGIPLTDAGGNTYLQSISPEQIEAAEIIKGPAGSLYGAGTGGAVLLHSPDGYSDSTENKLSLGYNMGSYGRTNPSASWLHSSHKNHMYLSASHYYAKGDRQQDTARKTLINYAAKFRLSPNLQLKLLGFYSDLHYQTPGGITLRQLSSDTTAYPLAVIQRAAIFNRTFFGGAGLNSRITNHIDNETSVLWSHTAFKNPFTTNYEKRKEDNYGGRSVFSIHDNNTIHRWQLLAGMEWIAGKAHIDNYGNNKGVPDTIQYKDKLAIQNKSFFVQFGIDLDPHNRWHLQTGISTNQQKLQYRRLSDQQQLKPESANTDYLWSPKIGLTFKVTPAIFLFATAAKGFSTPTLAEIHPSDGRFDQNLQPERGWNLESGISAHSLNNQLTLAGSVYRFKLKKAIVRRTDDNDIEYYVNAGATSQTGAELWAQYQVFAHDRIHHWISQVRLSGSYSFQPYHFSEYQIEDQIYDGNPLTGVPKNITVFTLNIQSNTGLYLHTVFNYTSRIPLNDASTVYADAYQLWQARLGYRFTIRKSDLELYFGMDNLLNQTYSLGNDINAYGGRYFNPAPGRNFFTGIQVHF